jgi:hypothetical protein
VVACAAEDKVIARTNKSSKYFIWIPLKGDYREKKRKKKEKHRVSLFIFMSKFE